MTSSSSTSGHGPAADVARTCPQIASRSIAWLPCRRYAQWHVPLAERLDRSFRASSLSASSTPFSCRRTLSLMKRGSVSSRLICWHSASVRTLHRACSGVLLIPAVAGAPPRGSGNHPPRCARGRIPRYSLRCINCRVPRLDTFGPQASDCSHACRTRLTSVSLAPRPRFMAGALIANAPKSAQAAATTGDIATYALARTW